jgi:nucleoid DNA-binding protein
MIINKEYIEKKIAKELGISLDTVKEIVKSQWSFVAGVIKGCDRTDPETFKNVNVQYFGKFAVKETKKKFYKGLKDDRTEDTN